MASLDSRLAALEQRSGQASDRIRLIHIGDDESPEQALKRVGATPAERVIFVTYVSPDPERAAKLAAGVLPQEMTTAELLIARDAIGRATKETDDDVAA